MPSHSGIYFAEHLPRQESTAYTIVYLHGAGGNYLCWPSTLRRLPTVHTLTIDLPGHGKSEPPGRQSVKLYSVQISEWLQQLQLKNLVLIGSGLGGMIALHCVSIQPDLISASVLVNPLLPLKIHNGIVDDLRNQITAPYGKVQTMQAMEITSNQPCLQEVRNAFLQVRPAVLAGDLAAWREYSLPEQMCSNYQPVCLLESAYNERRISAELHAANINKPLIQKIFHEGSGTFLPQEFPSWTISQIMDFLHRLPALIHDPFSPAAYGESYIPQEGKYAI